MITEDELEILLEALDAWVSEPSMRHMGTLPMLIALSDNLLEVKQNFEETGEIAESERKRRNYVATLLKAKMIQMTNSGTVNSVSEFLRNRDGEQD